MNQIVVDVMEETLEKAFEVKDREAVRRFVELMVESVVDKGEYEEEQKGIREELKELALLVKNGFELVEKKFELVDRRFELLEQRFDLLERRIKVIERLIGFGIGFITLVITVMKFI